MRVSRSPRLLVSTVLTLVAGVLGPPVVAATSAAAAPSNAGTIVYLKGHDVYVARPDGTGERRLTRNGTAASPWRSPSGADDGTVVAARGTVVVRMDQWGTILNSFDPPDLWDSAGQTIGGQVVHAVVSPDGSKVAYTYQHYTCPPQGACRTRWTTAVSAATALTSPQRYGFAFYPDPSWVTGSRLILGGNTDDLNVFDLATSTRMWFYDAQPNVTDPHDLFEPAVSRDGSTLATVRGVGAEQHLMAWTVSGNILSGPMPGWPTWTCRFTGAESFSSPTFAPASTSLAWTEPDGVWVMEDPLACETDPALAIPGGRAPQWTGAALQSVRPTYPDPPASAFALTSAPTLKSKGAVRPGKRVRATAGSWTPAPTAVRFQWLRDGKPIKKATQAAYRIKRADRRHRLSVRVTVRRAGYVDAVAVSKKVKVKR
jgi:hypothetical protein